MVTRRTLVKHAREAASRLQCLECGGTFRRCLGRNSTPHCPKCGSYDLEVAA